MPYFRKRPTPIEAKEFTSENAEDIVLWSKGNVVRSGDSGMYLTVTTRDGEKTATLGDWVVRGEEGDFYTVNRKDFIQRYRPA